MGLLNNAVISSVVVRSGCARVCRSGQKPLTRRCSYSGRTWDPRSQGLSFGWAFLGPAQPNQRRPRQVARYMPAELLTIFDFGEGITMTATWTKRLAMARVDLFMRIPSTLTVSSSWRFLATMETSVQSQSISTRWCPSRKTAAESWSN